MHFYTYDEWVANATYSKDDKDISVGESRAYKLYDAHLGSEDVVKTYLKIRSCWRNPVFISTYSKSIPIIKPTTPEIDCDLGCLYEYEFTNSRTTTEIRKGCIQNLNDMLGTSTNRMRYEPYINLQYEEEFNNFTQQLQEVMTVNLRNQLRDQVKDNDYPYPYHVFNRILVFQSIYSGSISYQEMNGSLEFYFTDDVNDNNIKTYDCRISTDLNSSDSLMLAAAMLRFDRLYEVVDGNRRLSAVYLNIENLSRFVYGHVDMDHKFDWNLRWETFQPPENAEILDSSIMHFTKR